ncbi:MAG: hypothetical protein P4L41_10950 [Flavipsychrobacter sp.]|nr:hypothetical protein [Flavipsychrobacter sp.]
MKKMFLFAAILITTLIVKAQPTISLHSNLPFEIIFNLDVSDGSSPCTGTTQSYVGGYLEPSRFFDGTSSGSITDPGFNINSSVWGWPSSYSPTYYVGLSFYSNTCGTFYYATGRSLCSIPNSGYSSSLYYCVPFPPFVVGFNIGEDAYGNLSVGLG